MEGKTTSIYVQISGMNDQNDGRVDRVGKVVKGVSAGGAYTFWKLQNL